MKVHCCSDMNPNPLFSSTLSHEGFSRKCFFQISNKIIRKKTRLFETKLLEKRVQELFALLISKYFKVIIEKAILKHHIRVYIELKQTFCESYLLSQKPCHTQLFVFRLGLI